jgi:hypothetical protein
VYPCGSGRFSPATGIPRICQAALPALTDDPDALYDRLAAEVPRWPRRDAADHCHALFGFLARVLGRRMVVERTGGSLLYAQMLRDVFPRARFVHMYRDGPDCALSMSRHTVFRRGGLLRAAALEAGLSWPSPSEVVMASLPEHFAGLLTPPFDPWRYMTYPIPLIWFGDYWSHSTTTGIAALRKLPGDSWISVKYEDLLSAQGGAYEAGRVSGCTAVAGVARFRTGAYSPAPRRNGSCLSRPGYAPRPSAVMRTRYRGHPGHVREGPGSAVNGWATNGWIARSRWPKQWILRGVPPS